MRDGGAGEREREVERLEVCLVTVTGVHLEECCVIISHYVSLPFYIYHHTHIYTHLELSVEY